MEQYVRIIKCKIYVYIITKVLFPHIVKFHTKITHQIQYTNRSILCKDPLNNASQAIYHCTKNDATETYKKKLLKSFRRNSKFSFSRDEIEKILSILNSNAVELGVGSPWVLGRWRVTSRVVGWVKASLSLHPAQISNAKSVHPVFEILNTS